MRGYYLFPDIYGDEIIFVTEDDLWKYAKGIGQRLTSDFGVVLKPKFSPDGKWIAFTRLQQTDQGTTADVYVVPSEGGEPKRITYFGTPFTRVVGWTPDGRVLVYSDFKTPFPQWRELYAISLDGIYERLNLGPATALVYGDGGIVVLGRNTYDLPYWKRYKGGARGVLWISRDGGRTFEKFLDLPGNITSPMIVGGRVYFLSDHEGVGNLYSVDFSGRDMRRHTNFKDYYARNANSDGKRIVFQAAGDIWLYDPATERLEKLEIDLPLSRKAKMAKFVDPVKYLEYFALASGERIVLVSRGQAFVMPSWEGAVIQIGHRGGGVRYKHISTDGEKVAVATYDGAVEVYNLEGVLVKRIEPGIGLIEALALKQSKIAAANHRGELWVIDIDTGNVQMADKSEYGLITGIVWHPAGRWLAYAKPSGIYTQNIRIYDAATGKIYDVTSPTAYDYSPAFDPEGRYLYFLSRRALNPALDPVQFSYIFAKHSKPYLAVLRRGDTSPFVQYKKADVKAEEVDLEGIETRVEPFPVEEGLYASVVGLKGGKVAWLKYDVEGALRYYLWSAQERRGAVEIYDLETKTRDQLVAGASSLRASPDGKYLLVKEENRLRLIDVEKKPDLQSRDPGRKSGVLDMGRVKVYVEPEKEWRQMFREAWLLMRENYWRGDLNGVDWDAVYKKYEPLLSRIGTRYELSDLINEMQGELGTSHAYEIVPDFEVDKPYLIGGLGAEFKWDGKCWRIAKIFVGDPSYENEKSPLLAPGVDVREGDCIISIAGVRLGPNAPPEYALLNRTSDVVTVEVERGGEVKAFTVRTVRDEKYLIYRHWVEANRRYVHQRTGGAVGYIHIPDMGPAGYAEFFKSLNAEGDKEAFIIDVRYNRGGHTSGMLILRASVGIFGRFLTRYFKPYPYPELVLPRRLVLVTNEHAGSDGDIFTYDFKRLKLGPVVGKRTWGGTVGIDTRYKLVDGTIITQPKYAFWADDVGTGIEGSGVEPDVEVEIAPHEYREGRDTQLEKAIQIIEKK
ncbi:tricorn protease [Pyrobaculum aerophilum str. IM2]|uniref:Tricorn protease homolog n=2 Tax=Pyrobaculum aerophilum TaxID=13773 RepID=Q8ZXG0_PYRAE|nr:S41 family peptidase [Pyrobaculum aerophilum]AAL63388.1 tricorn protease [Pyrobaculum aerophilum str. IM2]HII47675.1 peptidase S41 [Pyrobaculum aerophilum]